MATTIDLADVLAGLAAAQVQTAVLDGRAIDDPDPQSRSTAHTRRQEVAATSRDLLHLADRLQALSSVVRSEYWAIKGQEPLL